MTISCAILLFWHQSYDIILVTFDVSPIRLTHHAPSKFTSYFTYLPCLYLYTCIITENSTPILVQSGTYIRDWSQQLEWLEHCVILVLWKHVLLRWNINRLHIAKQSGRYNKVIRYLMQSWAYPGINVVYYPKSIVTFSEKIRNLEWNIYNRFEDAVLVIAL